MKKLFCFILLVGVFACNKTPLPIAPETGEEDAYSPRAAKYALSSVPSFPELMTPVNVMAHIEANGITSVDSFLMALPPFHQKTLHRYVQVKISCTRCCNKLSSSDSLLGC